MRKLFLFTLILISFHSFNSFSQDFICGVDDQEIINHFNNIPANSNFTNSVYDADTKYVFNVRFHVVYNDDGVTRTNNVGDVGIPIGFDEVMNAIRDLNVNFNQFNIYFKYFGFDKINETDYLQLETYEEMTQLRTAYSISNAINIFIVNGTVFGAPARTNFFDDNWFIRSWTQCHEMGHNFGLVHVYAATNGICERATRDIQNPNFNATTAGDWVLDTHAFGNANDNNFTNCNYIGGAIDCHGAAIEPATLTNGYFVAGPPYNNFLNAEDIYSTCLPSFTPGQGVRMRNAITGYWASSYNAQMNTIESLYQPFEEITFGGNTVISIEDLEDGNANVCRNLKVRHRFQKGFDYVFPDNDGNPDLNIFGVNDLPENINHDLNYNVIINQIDPNSEGTVLLCTRGQFCEIEPFISGIDIKTDFLGSYNFTVEEWDRLKVSDPDLYQYLESNKYHIIKKETDKGVIYQVTIYKP